MDKPKQAQLSRTRKGGRQKLGFIILKCDFDGKTTQEIRILQGAKWDKDGYWTFDPNASTAKRLVELFPEALQDTEFKSLLERAR